jgi:hypothetical protein
MDSKSAMRGFDSLPADVRAALHEVSMPIAKARRLVKLNPANAAAIIMAKHHDALSMQRTFTMQLEFRGGFLANV